MVCSAWPEGKRKLGTPDHMYHMLEPYLTFYNTTQKIVGENYVNYNLARLITRLVSRKTYQNFGALPLFRLENCLGYLELDPSMTIEFSKGIKMVIALFEIYFGTEAGNSIRETCIKNQWPLVWATNPAVSYPCYYPGKYSLDNFTVGVDPVNVRILDPYVLKNVPAGYNVTVDGIVSGYFEIFWGSWNVTGVPREKVAEYWSFFTENFNSTELMVEPLYFGACSDLDCVGVNTISKNCVCNPN